MNDTIDVILTAMEMVPKNPTSNQTSALARKLSEQTKDVKAMEELIRVLEVARNLIKIQHHL